MDLGERIRKHQQLQRKNSEVASPSQESILQQLARLRTLNKGRTQPAESTLSYGQEPSILGGEGRNNSAGSYLYLETLIKPTGMESESAAPDKAVASLLNWLQLSKSSQDMGEVAFLDTETTGLSGGVGTCAFLIGLGTWQSGGFRVEQFFMRDFNEEQAMLLELEERLSRIRVVVTYNGKSFDLPLLESRFVLSRRNWARFEAIHLDLVHPARRLWKMLLGDCSLGNLEKQVLRIQRENDVPGSLIPALYFNYVRTGIPRGIKAILDHNRQDIRTLANLAERVASILTGDPDNSLVAAEELLSAGKYCQSLGRRQESLQFSQAALERELPSHLRCEALTRSAEVLKAQQCYSQAAAIWKAVIADAPGFPHDAYLNLAIHYEHRQRDYRRALELTQCALSLLTEHRLEKWRTQRVGEWEHRKKRLLRKLANLSSTDGTRFSEQI
jgi:uncharacterized protein YprB with RNaseH-like and TPR domain